ncbi:N-acetylmuramoyl-L-alanine amidase [Neobacillus niacini]|uniref:N-acetylmuramoyl-L-alanine amidase n=1 Tax=Neobacillus niacini TaxID=86668 RepID=UPI0006936FD5|nr:N-acetylmuramoyl-L-alanine amidase [Neobacillus niacini]
MFIKKFIVFIIFCLVMSSLYSPNLAFAQENSSDVIHAEYVELIERADIFDKDQKIVGEINPATQLSVETIQDGKVYFQWDGNLVYIQEKSTKIVAPENITFTVVGTETGVTSEKFFTHNPTEVYADSTFTTPILKIAPEVHYSITKMDNEYYSITVGNREGIIKSGDVELLSTSIEQANLPLEKNSILQESTSARVTTSAQVSAPPPSIYYTTHVQNIGWLQEVSDGALSGTVGNALHVEAVRIWLKNAPVSGGISYKTHVQELGWMDNVSDGQISGTTGQIKQAEAIQMKLTGEMANQYDVYYRVHSETFGWLGWAKNGESAGTEGLSKQLEAIEVRLVSKGSQPPGSTDTPFLTTEPSIVYSTYVENHGWLNSVTNGEMSGTEGQGLRLEAIKIALGNTSLTGGISYKTHVQNDGWLPSVSNGEVSGTTGENKQVEAIQLNLTGQIAEYYDVYYRVHSATIGWLGWAKNGESAGTESLSKQLEAIEVRLVSKGSQPPGSTDTPFLTTKPSVVYSTHVENYGWMNSVANGEMSGTQGQSLHVEAIQISLKNAPFTGGISYQTHVQDYGWLDVVSDGETSGTTGKNKQAEAIQMNLTGKMAEHYDVYYRVHIQDFGWLGWAKDGMKAGSEGHSKRIEAIEIKLVPKGQGAPVSASAAFKKPVTVFLDPGHGGKDPGAVSGIYHEADLNLAVAKKVESLLSNRGYQVYMSRTNDTYLGLIDRPQMANNLAADILVSIHTNSTGAGTTTATGIESYFYEYDPLYPSKINEEMHNNPERILKSVTLTSFIQENMISYTGAYDRGTHGETLAVLREAAMPATLLEMGFINNASDRQKLFTDSYQNQLAKAIADGIHEYFTIY